MEENVACALFTQFAGRWTFQDACRIMRQRSNNQKGEFAASSHCDPPLARHGQIHVAADHRHFEHADGTPFFWLATLSGTAPHFCGKRMEAYAGVRASQGFTVAQVDCTPAADARGLTPFSGTNDLIIRIF